ncbi:hypothetical protein [Lacipirellula sp.]|uniref:hypothetical protein n=1 Tax=Lacipirellula sp. TaxID=2691419 RepID=UPI003D1232C2
MHEHSHSEAKTETPTQHTPPTSESNLGRVPKIVRIEYALAEDDPTTLLVTAYGKLLAGELSDVHLLRREYVQPPVDGIWEFDFLTTAPPEKTSKGETEARATARWTGYDQSMAGIRVYGVGKGVKEVRYHPDGCK